ncbi:MAG TPA: ATP-binding protein [Candidatus Acidoferrum sp.]|nr:ATP-binding protein [Candidatus Acidoferrum sp.]
MRARIFWKLGLTYVCLLLAVLFSVDLYSTRVLRSDHIRSVNEHLDSLMHVAQARPPRSEDPAELRTWAQWMAASGARVTVFDSAGKVLADTSESTDILNEESDRPEVKQAMASGSGESVRASIALGQEFAYRAVRFTPEDRPSYVVRLALPLTQVNFTLAELRQRLLAASVIILFAGAIVSLIFSRMFAARVERLAAFSRRIAVGDFRPLPSDPHEDELGSLRKTMNETAARLEETIRTLSGERNQSSAILRSMVEGVAVIDAQGKLVFYNRAFSEILVLPDSGMEGMPIIEVVRNTDLLNLIRRALRGEEGLQSDIFTGIVQPRCFAVTAAPVKRQAPDREVSKEGPTGAVVVLHDVTELRRLERVRQDFVANVSHEFKTPLTAIQGFAETLLGGALEDPRNNRRFLEIIREHAARLARLTDDLLKLARIEAGKLELEFLPMSLAELIEGCAETTLLKASHKQIVLEIEVPPGLPAVYGDSSLLREVLQNLLDNAIQYTPPGGRIRVSATSGAREAIVTVSDTGIGIPLADQERIFERFYRVDAARSREAGGTGLGLSIAKHIVDVHRGRIWVESQVGRGSDFSFSIPLAT